jgi:DNA-binding phage protein
LIGDKNITMEIQQKLKELIKQKGLRRMARELGIDHASLYRSLDSDLRWSRIKGILDLLGYDFEIVKRGGEKSRSKETPKGKGR